MNTYVKIISLVTFFIGSHLIIPKIAEATATFSTLTTRSFSANASNSRTIPKVKSENLKVLNLNSEADSEYEPPNHGGPDSRTGSGTR